MHELEIAQRLIDTAVPLLPAGVPHVSALHVQLGALAGISKDELLYGFKVVSAETAFADACLEIVEVPAVVYCPQCKVHCVLVDSDYPLCPGCGSPSVQVLEGKELTLTSIEVADEAVHV